MESTKKTLEDYKRLPYTLHLEPVSDSDGSKYWTAEYLELRGCKTDGATEAEAVASLQELFDDYVLARIESKAEIEVPIHIPVVAEKFTVVVQKRKFAFSHYPAVAEDTQQTSGQVKPETILASYEGIAA